MNQDKRQYALSHVYDERLLENPQRREKLATPKLTLQEIQIVFVVAVSSSVKKKKGRRL